MVRWVRLRVQLTCMYRPGYRQFSFAELKQHILVVLVLHKLLNRNVSFSFNKAFEVFVNIIKIIYQYDEDRIFYWFLSSNNKDILCKVDKNPPPQVLLVSWMISLLQTLWTVKFIRLQLKQISAACHEDFTSVVVLWIVFVVLMTVIWQMCLLWGRMVQLWVMVHLFQPICMWLYITYGHCNNLNWHLPFTIVYSHYMQCNVLLPRTCRLHVGLQYVVFIVWRVLLASLDSVSVIKVWTILPERGTQYAICMIPPLNTCLHISVCTYKIYTYMYMYVILLKLF